MLPPNTSFAHSKISKSHMFVYYTSILNLRVLTRARQFFNRSNNKRLLIDIKIPIAHPVII
ncbi:hypothetical protein DAHU10_013980 [Hanseniaspora uvarum]|nr:hypothetical protein DAHU10_013980 [Hanseniaspora uvarum]